MSQQLVEDIQDFAKEHSVSIMQIFRTAGVTPSSYYGWRDKKYQARPSIEQKIYKAIETIKEEGKHPTVFPPFFSSKAIETIKEEESAVMKKARVIALISSSTMGKKEKEVVLSYLLA